MAFELPPQRYWMPEYIATPDEGGGYTVPSGHYFKKKVGSLHLWVPVSESDPLPTDNANIDVALSALRDALLGTGNKTLSDLATALEPLATSEKQAALVSALGAIADAAVSDPTASGTVVSLLKGLLSHLQAGSPVSVTESNLPTGAATDAEIKNLQAKVDTLNAKLDAITDGTTPATTQLTGSKVKNAFEIIPDDATDLSHETIAIYVGFDGDLKVDLISGETITMYNLAAGAWHPIQAKRVYATGTTATYILGAY